MTPLPVAGIRFNSSATTSNNHSSPTGICLSTGRTFLLPISMEMEKNLCTAGASLPGRLWKFIPMSGVSLSAHSGRFCLAKLSTSQSSRTQPDQEPSRFISVRDSQNSGSSLAVIRTTLCHFHRSVPGRHRLTGVRFRSRISTGMDVTISSDRPPPEPGHWFQNQTANGIPDQLRSGTLLSQLRVSD